MTEQYYVKVLLDDEQIKNDNKYTLDSVYEALDYIFVEGLNLEKKDLPTYEVKYTEINPDDKTYAKLIGACLGMKKNCDWFKQYVRSWKIYSPDEGEEDLIKELLT